MQLCYNVFKQEYADFSLINYMHKKKENQNEEEYFSKKLCFTNSTVI